MHVRGHGGGSADSAGYAGARNAAEGGGIKVRRIEVFRIKALDTDGLEKNRNALPIRFGEYFYDPFVKVLPQIFDEPAAVKKDGVSPPDAGEVPTGNVVSNDVGGEPSAAEQCAPQQIFGAVRNAGIAKVSICNFYK